MKVNMSTRVWVKLLEQSEVERYPVVIDRLGPFSSDNKEGIAKAREILEEKAKWLQSTRPIYVSYKIAIEPAFRKTSRQ
jgi:hypothetical protein